jgi:transposase
MVEDLTKRFLVERTRSNSTPFRQSGRQKTFKPAVSEKRWAAIRQAYKRLQRPCQVRRFA